jgi:hypothetical protein
MSKHLIVSILLCSAAGIGAIGSATGKDGGAGDQSAAGAQCSSADDCGSGLTCGFPRSEKCEARGICIPFRKPGQAHCMSLRLECGCGGKSVSVPCDFPADYAPAPVSGLSLASCRLRPLVRPRAQ